MENKQARRSTMLGRAWNGPARLTGRGLQRLDARVEVVVLALHAFVHCQRRLNIDPPCRSKIDPGRVAEI